MSIRPVPHADSLENFYKLTTSAMQHSCEGGGVYHDLFDTVAHCGSGESTVPVPVMNVASYEADFEWVC